MRSPENIKAVAALAPDFLGFIFYAKSKRYVGESWATKGLEDLAPSIKKVGVFVKESLANVEFLAKQYDLDYLQLHGGESVDYCQELKAKGYRIIKVFSVGESFDFSQTKPFAPYADYFLFDTKGKDYGGNGIAFNWALLAAYEGETPFLLSGGIRPSDREKVQAFDHPKCVGIDVNSGFEIEPALKNIEDLAKFLPFFSD